MQRGQVTAKVTIKVFLMQLCPFSSENFHRKSNNHTPVFALLDSLVFFFASSGACLLQVFVI